MTTAAEMLATIRARLAAGKTRVGSSAGPLVNPTKSNLESDLVTVQSGIADFYGMVGDVGELDDSNLPEPLKDIADECWCLASAAVDIADAPDPDYSAIGNNLKRIDWMIDVADGYRDQAGITEAFQESRIILKEPLTSVVIDAAWGHIARAIPRP